MRQVTRPTARRRAATLAERDALFRDQFGPRWAELPWSGPGEAEAGATATERAQLAAARRTLCESWLDNPAQAGVQALRSIGRGTVAIHGGARGQMPFWILHDAAGRVSRDANQLLTDARCDMGKCRLYALEGGDPFAERPVNVSTLTRQRRNLVALCDLLSRIGLWHQLRVVSYDEDGRLLAYFGLYLPCGEPAFTLREHALLHALVPDLRRWIRTARVLGLAPLAETGLVAALENNADPSYLMRRDGVVVFANAAARALRRVADGLAQGLSDKEIAIQLDMPLATVRTYAARIYRSIGVSSRRELMRLAIKAT